jgi:hypothetical protein
VLVSLNEIQNIKERETLEQVLTYLEGVTDEILKPSFQDITNMFSNGAVFFIDGDSLLLNLMGNANYDTNNDGQLLHLIYLCERHLQLFSRKGGNFEVIFFNVWSQAWSGKHTLLLARSALMSHLRFNMSCRVHEFDSVWDVNFRQILEESNCAFMLTDFQMLDTYCKLFPREDHVLQALIFHVSIYYSLVGLYLGCVDMNDIELTVSTLNAFYCQPGVKLQYVKLRRLLHSVVTRIEDECRLLVNSTNAEESQLPPMEEETDVRHIVTVSAAARLLRDSSAPEPCEDWIRAFLIYSAVLEVLPLPYRGCTSYVVQTTAFTQFVEQLHKHMNCMLQTILHGNHNVQYNFSTISDLWHGNLFVSVLKYVTEYEIHEGILLGEHTLSVYDRLLEEVVRLTGEPLLNLPVKIEGIAFSEGAIVAEVNCSTENSAMLLPSLRGLNKLVPTNCLLASEFCGDILPRNRHVNDLTDYITRNSKFGEKYHWHSKKPMSDEYDHVDDNTMKPVNKNQLKKHDRIKSKYAHFMSIYGSSIEGRSDSSRSIVCESGNPSKIKVNKTKKPGKKAQEATENNQKKLQAEHEESDKMLFDVCESGTSSKKRVDKAKKPGKKTQKREENKAEKIRENNRRKLQAKREESDKKLFDVFKETYKRYRERGSYHEALDEVKRVERKVKTEQVLRSVLLHMVRILWYLWEDECKRFPVVSGRNLEYAKELFLVIRRVLKDFKSIALSDDDAKFLGWCLWKMGLERIAQCWNLPGPSGGTTNQSYFIGMSWIDFQLLHLGPELEREVGSTPDSRVEGFVPDDWQRKLFDSVDKHQSVLVVAPTSSGKTYASYYCMERVLRESNDGVVVYVAPTKALVNQVAATIYARFKNKDMPPGKSVYGVFTRDYRTNALNSQILITVPECLALLLLSPRRHSWVKNLRYVIFDEVHCLAGQAGGFSWECCLLLIRCPFLALSATIEDPGSLCRWLQEMQHFKHTQDIANGCEKPNDMYGVNLVVHPDRHADLKKHIYCEDGQFHHVHPCAYLDRALIIAEGRIPQSITLSPDEVHELYNAMSSVGSQDPRLNDLHPEVFFSMCTSGFISRKMVRDFEARLKSLLEDWATEDGAAFESVVIALRMVTEPLGDVSERRFIQENFIPFVQRLQEQNMLPAIVFSYNRSLVHTFFEDATEYYEDVVRQYEDSNKENKSEHCKRLGKDGMQDGNPKDKKGNIDCLDFRVSRGVPGRNKYEASLNLLRNADTRSGSVIGVGHADEKVVGFIEHRLLRIGCKQDHLFPRGLSVGIGMHHGGLNAKERSAVEMLFRMKVLNLVFATGTLALGIHMPCKTVVVIGDSPFLNPLEFHQMSGRAGRRGFDTEGNVVFMGLNERKMRRLLTGKLPRMVGNFPLNVTMVLRLLLMVSDITSNAAHSKEVTRDALSRCVSFWSICVHTFTAVESKVVTDLWCQSLSLLLTAWHLKNE